MIVGNGLLAQSFLEKFKKEEGVLIFASGVSNSKETRSSEFKREKELLEKYISTDSLLVYFSSTSVKDEHLATSPYALHKLEMEQFIQRNASKYLIVRASNIIGKKGNNATILNYLYDQIKHGKSFELWSKAKRNLLDIEDFSYIVETVISNNIENGIIEIYNFRSTSILDIVKAIEIKLGKKGVYNLIDEGGETPIEGMNLEKIMPKEFIRKLKNRNYLENLLEKYYE